MHLVVDGMNVIGSRPDGWWRDREAASRRVVGRRERLVRADGAEVTVVFDGHPRDDPSKTSTRACACSTQRDTVRMLPTTASSSLSRPVPGSALARRWRGRDTTQRVLLRTRT